MKKMKKIFALLIAMVMVLGMSTSVFAATTGSITINNAALGETYYIFKVLGATTNSTGGIDYTGTIPSELSDYLVATTKTEGGVTYNVIGKAEDKTNEELFAALKNWAVGTEETPDYSGATDSKIADSNVVKFENIDAGYYVIISTQGNVVMVDSATNPAAVVYEKNTTTPTIDPEEGKKVNDDDVYVGENVTYTITFTTANYEGSDSTAKKIVSYTIVDTLPSFLSNPTVSSIKVDGTPITIQQFTNGQIVIPWTSDGTEEGTSLYENGATIEITYSATVNSAAAIGSANTNKVTITWQTVDGTVEGEKLENEESIYTYAAALQKTDGTNHLPDATFSIAGISVEKQADGIYYVTDKGDSLNSGTLECDSDGKLVILGLDSEASLTVTEVAAPNGYNKLTNTVTLTPFTTSVTKTETTTYYDAEGNVVDEESAVTTETLVSDTDIDGDADGVLEIVNNKGVALPETGGMGTTIFYVVGGILVACAVILLVTKRRMNSK